MAYIIAPDDELTVTVNFAVVGNGLEIEKVLNQTAEEQIVEVSFVRIMTMAPPNESPPPTPGGGGTYSWGNA